MTEPRHLVIIGGQRCGTTYVAGTVGAHPDVAMARPARPEPKVFLSDEILKSGITGYRNEFFAHRGAEHLLLGEKSTSYIEHPDAIDRIRTVLGEPAILAQLRDPVARAVSNFRFTQSFGLEERTLVQALTENLEGPRDWDPERTSVSPYAYLERGRYADYLRPWLDAFPSGHVCFFEEVTDPERSSRAVQAIFSSLGLDPAAASMTPDPVNASSGEPPALPPSLEAELRDYFKDSDSALANLLDRQLSWPA